MLWLPGRIRMQVPSMNRRRLLALLAAGGCLSLLYLLVIFAGSAAQNNGFDNVVLDTTSASRSSETLRFYKVVDGLEMFLYSAIANRREPSPDDLNIIISGFDSTDTDSLTCCVRTKDEKLFTTRASVFYRFYNEPSFIGPYIQSFYAGVFTKAKQYACVVPEVGYEATHVTLTSSSCPSRLGDYLPIVYPQKVPGGLAICGKSAFGDQLDPHKLMEWFEVQRLLGVDHIQLMDLDNPAPVQSVFKYYSDMGLLNALPYELPGRPKGRGLDNKRYVGQQGDHDKSFSILDCTQRLRGYSFVMGIDLDEVLVPVNFGNVKDLAKHFINQKPDAAGFLFYTQFFVYDWGPTNKNSDVTMLRYLNSTIARNECKKYLYLPSRVSQARTHEFTPRSGYNIHWVETEDAVLHHYRNCPRNVWSTCFPDQRLTDRSMMRLADQLTARLAVARQAIGMSPPTF